MQEEYLDRADCIGFTRHGHPSQSGGASLAVVLNSGRVAAEKTMSAGKRHAGRALNRHLSARRMWRADQLARLGHTFALAPVALLSVSTLRQLPGTTSMRFHCGSLASSCLFLFL